MNPGYILVVDDEPDIRRLVQEILEDEHYKVVTAENAKAAREAVRKQRPDLVLLDIWMPDTDGISLLREWSQSGNLEMPVIMISRHGTVETAVEATRPPPPRLLPSPPPRRPPDPAAGGPARAGPTVRSGGSPSASRETRLSRSSRRV